MNRDQENLELSKKMNKEVCQKLTKEYLSNLDDIKILYMDNIKRYNEEIDKVTILQKLIRSKHQNSDLIEKIIKEHFHIMVLMEVAKSPKLEENTIKYIIEHLDNIILPQSAEWKKMNKSPKEEMAILLMDTLYNNPIIDDKIKRKLDKLFPSFFAQLDINTGKMLFTRNRKDLIKDEEHKIKRLVFYGDLLCWGADNSDMGLIGDIHEFVALGKNSNTFKVKSIYESLLLDSEIYIYDGPRLPLMFSNKFKEFSFLFIKNKKFYEIDEKELLCMKLAIDNSLPKIKNYIIEENDDDTYIIKDEHLKYLFNKQSHRIEDIEELN